MCITAIEYGPITAIDLSRSGNDWLVAGYQNGHIVLYDVMEPKPLKAITDSHSSPIVALKFTNSGTGFLSVDVKGVVNQFNMSKVLMMWVCEAVSVLNGSAGRILALEVLHKATSPSPVDDCNLLALATTTKVWSSLYHYDNIHCTVTIAITRSYHHDHDNDAQAPPSPSSPPLPSLHRHDQTITIVTITVALIITFLWSSPPLSSSSLFWSTHHIHRHNIAVADVDIVSWSGEDPFQDTETRYGQRRRFTILVVAENRRKR